jgi:hypothetical protein
MGSIRGIDCARVEKLEVMNGSAPRIIRLPMASITLALFGPTEVEEAAPARQIRHGKGKQTSRSRSHDWILR